MTNKIYPYETKITKDQNVNLARVKNKGDKWCRYHCADLHSSRLCYDDLTGVDYVIFQFREQSDLTAFRIGFDVYDI